MKVLTSFFILSVVFLNSSCTHQVQRNNILDDNDSQLLLFFSDESHYEKENEYYDAIIELKNQYPEEMSRLKVITSDQEEDYYEAFGIDHSPALIIIEQNKVVVHIKGQSSKDQIVQSVSNILVQGDEYAENLE
ncbi:MULTISPECIES: hypothetical protein [unclassified Bacillus (in: firmicutes)]|uniref:hypothetical protein n=1 Tax=unclassified Bacillus (in: firmicutes) TaxID=185979 RepID=UPI0008EE1D97|nr:MULTISPECIES: hypothetical protein [unclassified Bacillus (in: firmicutes)]SFA76435.1 Hydrogenase-1 expression protein HyaE [Bacillus sp. UNCCL13]SFQ66276.1 Hydrogenase-1 expression protein HyaE [Bacillus sp. cl95]